MLISLHSKQGLSQPKAGMSLFAVQILQLVIQYLMRYNTMGIHQLTVSLFAPY